MLEEELHSDVDYSIQDAANINEDPFRTTFRTKPDDLNNASWFILDRSGQAQLQNRRAYGSRLNLNLAIAHKADFSFI